MTDFNSFRNAVFCWLVGWFVLARSFYGETISL